MYQASASHDQYRRIPSLGRYFTFGVSRSINVSTHSAHRDLPNPLIPTSTPPHTPARLEQLEPRHLLSATFMVTTALDVVDPYDGELSLREAIVEAATSQGHDTIQFHPSLDKAVLYLDRASGQLLISSDMTIEGPGSDRLVVYANASADQPGRIIAVEPGVNVSLIGLTLSGGYMTGDETEGIGGGIYSQADHLLLDDVLINSCFATHYGGGVSQQGGVIEILNSNIGYNHVGELPYTQTAGGGGLYLDNTSAVIVNSRITGNHVEAMAESHGGGICTHGGSLQVTGSTIDNNVLRTDFIAGPRYGFGGGLYGSAAADLTVTNSTVSNNMNESKLGGGGGIFAAGTLIVVNSTVTANLSPWEGGGIECPDAVLHNTIVAGNRHGNSYYRLAYEPDDFSGGQGDSSYNLIGAYISGNLVNGVNGNRIGTIRSPIDPLLGVLEDNGGDTPTHLLLTGSPAIDGGSDSAAVDAGLTTDQRGADRFVRDVDMGAVELQSNVAGPVNVVASADDLHVMLEWDDGGSDRLYNVIYRSDSPGGRYERVAIAFMTDHVVDSNVVVGATYSYRITTVTTTGHQSDFSAVVTTGTADLSGNVKMETGTDAVTALTGPGGEVSKTTELSTGTSTAHAGRMPVGIHQRFDRFISSIGRFHNMTRLSLNGEIADKSGLFDVLQHSRVALAGPAGG